ncbi:MAG: hypothetical protein KDA86_27940, partial [Planctomycetaceae bacterium]|nr:hypothetical protein [Planctomycetaceae bacterium]
KERLENLHSVRDYMQAQDHVHTELLQLVRRDAGEAEVALHELRQPELDAMIQFVLTYGSSLAGLQSKKGPMEKGELGLAH